MSFFPEIREGAIYTPPKQKRKKHKKKKLWVRLFKKVSKQTHKPKYAVYIKSKAWRNRRNEFFKKFGKKCVICGNKVGIGVHHISYDHLGNERDEELVALCWDCHLKFHETHESRGKDMRENTHQFIIEQQEIIEMYKLEKTL